MLEYLKFSAICYIQGVFEIKVEVNDGIVSYSMLAPFASHKKELSAEKSKVILGAIEEIEINKWRSNYASQDGIYMDGTFWKLDYKVSDKRCRHINGDNVYPDNFDLLVNAFYILSKFEFLEIFEQS